MENKSHALAAGTFVLLLTALLIALASSKTRSWRLSRVSQTASAISSAVSNSTKVPAARACDLFSIFVLSFLFTPVSPLSATRRRRACRARPGKSHVQKGGHWP